MDKIKILVLDVDGTLTDGKVYMGTSGEQMKAFDIKDGYGLHDILPRLDIIPVIITGRTSDILTMRCKELEITHYYQGIQDKLKQLNKVLDALSVGDNEYTLANVAYCGDDCNDLSCMVEISEHGGIVGCPQDAVDEVRKIADFISTKKGGNGAVRSFIEWISKRTT